MQTNERKSWHASSRDEKFLPKTKLCSPHLKIKMFRPLLSPESSERTNPLSGLKIIGVEYLKLEFERAKNKYRAKVINTNLQR